MIRCTVCGRFIKYQDILEKKASVHIFYVNLGDERMEAFCRRHNGEVPAV